MKKLAFIPLGSALLMITVLACAFYQSIVEKGFSSAPSTQNAASTTPPVIPSSIAETPAQVAGQTTSVSPSPSLIIGYVKDGNIWLWAESGATRAITSSGNAWRLKISGDGKIIAYERQVDDYHYELRAVNTDGSGDRNLVSTTDLDALEPEKWLEYAYSLVPYHFDWIPGTHTLAYNTRQTFEGPGLALFNDLRLVNADTGVRSTLLQAGEGGEFVYSPDGKQIVLINVNKIRLVNADGSNQRQVMTYNEVSTYSEYAYYAQPVWASDSTSLRVAIPPAEALVLPAQPTTLWYIPTDGAPASQTGSIQAAPFFGSEMRYSPDFTYVVYISEVGSPQDNRRQMHVAETNGQNDYIFLDGQFMLLDGWGGDPNHFMFQTGDPLSFQVGDISSRSYRPLTANPIYIGSVRWVDDQRFVYTQGQNDLWELRLEILGGASTLLDTISGSSPEFDLTMIEK